MFGEIINNYFSIYSRLFFEIVPEPLARGTGVDYQSSLGPLSVFVFLFSFDLSFALFTEVHKSLILRSPLDLGEKLQKMQNTERGTRQLDFATNRLSASCQWTLKIIYRPSV